MLLARQASAARDQCNFEMGNNSSNGFAAPEIQEHLLEAAKQKNVKKALAAIDGGANINYIYRSSEGETNTILLTSIIRNDEDMVKMLVDKHVDPSFRDDLGWNALLYSCWETKVSDELAKVIILYSIEKGCCILPVEQFPYAFSGAPLLHSYRICMRPSLYEKCMLF